MKFKELDVLLHSQLRLAVMSILVSVESADFVYIKQQTEATAGNLSVQLEKLQSAGYISIEKGYKEKLLKIPEFSKWLQNKGRLLNDNGR